MSRISLCRRGDGSRPALSGLIFLRLAFAVDATVMFCLNSIPLVFEDTAILQFG
ncbi:hypothetical protein [Marilutibacter alkalisoli]|uniref:hypothetical protein n=1 Tax=Marilutibacter alkalisoli TaxID=2591633 RepID=UPI0014203D67|nr:hypothetical protein [Lysobacter alkalisoli]